MKEYRRSTGTMTALLSGRSTDVRKAEVNRDEPRRRSSERSLT
jgi:hypothetical protein